MHQALMVGPYPTHDFRAVESGCHSRRVAVPLCNLDSAWHNVEMYGLRSLTKPQEVDTFRAQYCVKEPFCDTKTSRKIGIGRRRKIIKLSDRQMGFED